MPVPDVVEVYGGPLAIGNPSRLLSLAPLKIHTDRDQNQTRHEKRRQRQIKQNPEIRVYFFRNNAEDEKKI
jgi:hypothetical protein